jgi:hypothetical protein
MSFDNIIYQMIQHLSNVLHMDLLIPDPDPKRIQGFDKKFTAEIF